MARSRKPVEDVEMDLDAELDEATELELDADEEEVEAVEASDESDDAAEGETKTVTAKKAAPVKKPRARKPRAPRKAKEPVASMLESMSQNETESEPSLEINENEEKVEKRAKPVLAREPEVKIDLSNDGATVREDVAIASVSINKSMDNMAKQWGTVKEISSSVCASLERVNTMLKEVPTQDLFKPQMARPAAITKIAVGFSAVAFVLSLVSLLLSQSARQASFERAQLPAPSTRDAVVARVARPQRPVELAVTDSAAKDPIAAIIAPTLEPLTKKSAGRRAPRTQRSAKRSRR